MIKDLIDLIKKAGGIEELEKQIHIQEQSDLNNKTDLKATTPPNKIVNKSLVNKIKNRASLLKLRTPISNGVSQPPPEKELSTTLQKQMPIESFLLEETTKKYSSINRFSRPTSQSVRVEKFPESDAILIEKPQYTSILRKKTAKPEVIAENDYNNDSDRDTLNNEENSKLTINDKKYTTIKRFKPVADINEEYSESEEQEEIVEQISRTINTSKSPPKYINLNRRRLSTTEKLVYLYKDLCRDKVLRNNVAE